jgi:hypothetical protein
MEILDKLPETIVVDESILKKKRGRKGTIAERRKSQPVKGKVKGRRNHFTEEEKLNAVCVFAVSGNSRRTAEITGVPEGTIRSWKTTEWWNQAMGRIMVEQDEELDTKLTKLIDKAVEHVNDRLENGDFIYDTKRGALVRKPVSAKDLTVVTAIAVDKRQLLRGQPTSRVEKVSEEERLRGLADRFKEFDKFSKAQTIEQEPVEEIEEVEEDEWEDEPLTINEMFSEEE